MKSRRSGISFSTVVGQRLGLYSKTRRRLIDVEQGRSSKGADENNRLLLGHSDAQFEKYVRVVLREIGNHQLGLDKAVDDRRLNHVTALSVGGLDVEAAFPGGGGRRDDAAEDFCEKSGGMPGLPFNERENNEAG